MVEIIEAVVEHLPEESVPHPWEAWIVLSAWADDEDDEEKAIIFQSVQAARAYAETECGAPDIFNVRILHVVEPKLYEANDPQAASPPA